MKICPMGAELFHAHRRRDRHDEDNSRFSQVCERAKKKNVPVKINLHIFRAEGHVTVYHNTMQCPHYREFTFVVKWFVYNLHKQVAVVLCPFETERCIVL